MHEIDAKEAARLREERDAGSPKPPTCVLQVGQRVKLEGGTFRVKSIGKRFVVLEGIPGTRAGQLLE